MIGYIIGLSTASVGGRYVALFLMANGYSGESMDPLCIWQRSLLIKNSTHLLGFALTAVWVSNAVPRPPAKRSVSIAIVNGFGNLGNL